MEKITKEQGNELCEKAVALRVEQMLAYRSGDSAKAEKLNAEVAEIIKTVGLAFDKTVTFKVVAEANKVLDGRPRSTIGWL